MLAAAGLLVTPNAISVKEGESAAIAMRLQNAPTAPVTIHVSCSDTSEAVLATNSVTCDSTNWSKPQRIVVRDVAFRHDGVGRLTDHPGVGRYRILIRTPS